MSYPAYRHGTFAVVDGVTHQATYSNGNDLVSLHSWQRDNPNPSWYRWDDYRGQWVAEVPVERCQRIYSVRVYVTYRGQSVLVDHMNSDGMARIFYAGHDGGWATENGFLQENKVEYYKTVPVTELQDYFEKQDDLLFMLWRKENFARPNVREPDIGQRPRAGLFATVSGVRYAVHTYADNDQLVLKVNSADNPDPKLFSWQENSWQASLFSADCERLVRITTRAEYVGYPCEVADISPDGKVNIYYLGTNIEQAEVDGFSADRDGRCRQTVDIFDLTRYHERHEDLLFDRWARPGATQVF